MLAALILLSALLIEGIGTFISILGLASLFSSSPLVLLMVAALDIGKVVAVTFVYKYWREINSFMKAYMLAAIVVLMVITSTGVFGFLSAEFQKAISGTNEQAVLINSLSEERSRLQERKSEIDAQIAQLPGNVVRGRTTLMRQFEPELNRLNSRLAEIDSELPKLKVDAIKKNVEVGPIVYVAEAFDTTPEKAVKWVILVIIFVFDPLAVALLVAANFLLSRKIPAVADSSAEASPDPKSSEKVISAHESKQATEVEDKPIIDSTGETQKTAEVVTAAEVVEQKPEAPHKVEAERTEESRPAVTEAEPSAEEQIPAQARRSSLEDVDAGKIDVEFGDDAMKNFRNLNSIYSSR
jgi:hypothetical protein